MTLRDDAAFLPSNTPDASAASWEWGGNADSSKRKAHKSMCRHFKCANRKTGLKVQINSSHFNLCVKDFYL